MTFIPILLSNLLTGCKVIVWDHTEIDAIDFEVGDLGLDCMDLGEITNENGTFVYTLQPSTDERGDLCTIAVTWTDGVIFDAVTIRNTINDQIADHDSLSVRDVSIETAHLNINTISLKTIDSEGLEATVALPSTMEMDFDIGSSCSTSGDTPVLSIAHIWGPAPTDVDNFDISTFDSPTQTGTYSNHPNIMTATSPYPYLDCMNGAYQQVFSCDDGICGSGQTWIPIHGLLTAAFPMETLAEFITVQQPVQLSIGTETDITGFATISL